MCKEEQRITYGDMMNSHGGIKSWQEIKEEGKIYNG